MVKAIIPSSLNSFAIFFNQSDLRLDGFVLGQGHCALRYRFAMAFNGSPDSTCSHQYLEPVQKSSVTTVTPRPSTALMKGVVFRTAPLIMILSVAGMKRPGGSISPHQLSTQILKSSR